MDIFQKFMEIEKHVWISQYHCDQYGKVANVNGASETLVSSLLVAALVSNVI
tara:strand:+ start:312 stop:467 length:156 start_codon:yes stop_codon:yes gene_type:complete